MLLERLRPYSACAPANEIRRNIETLLERLRPDSGFQSNGPKLRKTSKEKLDKQKGQRAVLCTPEDDMRWNIEMLLGRTATYVDARRRKFVCLYSEFQGSETNDLRKL